MYSYGGGGGGWGGGGWGGGGGYDDAEYEEYRKKLAEESAARLQRIKDQQAAIDAETDPAAQLELRRARYKCGDRYVQAADMETFDQVAALLPGLPDNTRCDTSGGGGGGGGFWASANDTITIEESDVQRRKPVDPELLPKISLYRGDITALEVDAVVNAANESLMGGGGIDGAIHSAAGALLSEECRPLGGCDTGDTKITKGYCLPAKHILHTVGPIGKGDRQLRSCYRTCLELVEQHNLRTVAFCCVGTGIFSFPLVRATHIALSETRKWLDKIKARPRDGSAGYSLASLDRVIFCCFKETELMAYERIAPSYFPPSDTFPVAARPSPVTEEGAEAVEEEEEFNLDNARRWEPTAYETEGCPDADATPAAGTAATGAAQADDDQGEYFAYADA